MIQKQRARDFYKNPDQEFDLVSCQFAFHYCFESLPQADCMLRNASENLRKGGFFIGTTPDAHDIMARLEAGQTGNSFGNSVFSVSFKRSPSFVIQILEHDSHNMLSFHVMFHAM